MEPFTTTDHQLALALITAGCSFAPQSEGGPARNIFSPGALRAIGRLPTTGLASIAQFEAAALSAHADGKEGTIRYLIARNDTFFAAMKAWDNMVEEFHKAGQENRSPVLPEIPTEAVMQSLYMRRMNEKACANIAFLNRPRCSLVKEKSKHVEPMMDGKVELAGNKTTTTGSLKEWTPPMSAEDRATLKL